jgi:hypothetical protein
MGCMCPRSNLVNPAHPCFGSLARSQSADLSTFHAEVHASLAPTSPSGRFPFMFYPVVGARINMRRKTTLPILLAGSVLLAGCEDYRRLPVPTRRVLMPAPTLLLPETHGRFRLSTSTLLNWQARSPGSADTFSIQTARSPCTWWTQHSGGVQWRCSHRYWASGVLERAFRARWWANSAFTGAV